MGSLRPQNQKYNQTMDGSAPSPKSGLDPTQPIDPATKHTVSGSGRSTPAGGSRGRERIDLAQLGMGGDGTMGESTRNKNRRAAWVGKTGERQVDPTAKPGAGAGRAGARAGGSDGAWLGR